MIQHEKTTLANEDKLALPRRHIVQSYSKIDVPTLPSLAVYVELINDVVRTCDGSIDEVRTVQLEAAYFYFLLRAGKSAKPKKIEWHNSE